MDKNNKDLFDKNEWAMANHKFFIVLCKSAILKSVSGTTGPSMLLLACGNENLTPSPAE